ncbi:hypothetical protein SAMD00019534_066630 [Acytostelium subglobosum LB1]|uniref:hypothetical protein n=1 Tax=Acytostelium subglobosum LB1 TaxID=1410327 RepID=UPI000644AD5A|nr:hypothetical protein SAMD00019534_066630 [Acytostelium subglobosum LB1]GAM23488.1 hypothetical protein SAMD00019534_066630 [Acytostelium subglobosum LB1]|eukprot:XP_012753229.1 hypothetical protein SAMD00019534_066630 [Acytostelium subglobosum LB1]
MFAGIIMLFYLPLLFIYLYYTIQPQYGSLPSCCACANMITPSNSWVYMAVNDTCSNSTSCKNYIQTQLKLNCDAALQYLPVPDYNITINIAQIGCVGMKPGDTCDSACMDVSNRWITNLDYTYEDNRDQAKIRCPFQIGACDFKAVYSAQESVPHAVCRYPEISGILTKLGAGLGLLNGTLITFRLLLRAWWNRIGRNGDASGTINDYWKGLLIGLIFNYLGIAYLTVATGINKRFRYGGQLAIGFLIIFFKSPFTVYLIIIFSQYWTPMTILFTLGCLGVSILIRTTYNLLNLEIYSRNCVVMSQDMDRFENDEVIEYVPPDRIKPVLYSKWRHFLIGLAFNLFALYPLLRHNLKRYSGMKAGFYCSISIGTLLIAWTTLYAIDGWQYFTFNFPFPLYKAARSSNNGDGSDSGGGTNNTASSEGASSSLNMDTASLRQLYITSILQSTYFAVTWSVTMVIVYHLSLFIKYLPETGSILPSFMRRPLGTKTQFHIGFMVSILPLVFTYFCFFFFKLVPYVTRPLPSSPDDCSFPGWSLIIPMTGIIPAIALFIFARTERFRYGSLTAIGVSLIVFCLGTSALLFNYCLGSTQDIYYPGSWFVGLIGTYILIYGSIRPNPIFILDKREPGVEYFEDERLLVDKSLN